jgi:hypothetical protein
MMDILRNRRFRRCPMAEIRLLCHAEHGRHVRMPDDSAFGAMPIMKASQKRHRVLLPNVMVRRKSMR